MDSWAAQLRGYRKQTDNPKSRLSSRRGLDAYNVNDKTSGSDCGGYSLYSESLSEDNPAAVTKDLDRCARLLGDMLSNDKETTEKLHNERKKETGKGKVQKTGTKKSLNKRKETKLRGILTKKVPPKGTHIKNKTNQPARKSLFSDSDSSMKSSIVAPPLNNSDAIRQAAVTPCVVTNTGPVLTTSQPLTTQPPPHSTTDRPVSPFKITGPNLLTGANSVQTNRPLFNNRIPSSTPAVATPNNKSGKSRSEPEENQIHPDVTSGSRVHVTHPDVTSGSRVHMVNAQDLADKLHGLSSGNRQPVQNLHQGDYQHPQNNEHPSTYTGPPGPSTWPQWDIPPHKNLEQASTKEHWDYPTGGTAGRPLTNSPPERLRKNLVRTADGTNVATCKENRKKTKSKKPKNAEKPTETQDNETNVIEENREGVYNTGAKRNVEQDREDDVTVEDTSSNVYEENNRRLHHPRLSPVSRQARLRTLRYLMHELSCSAESDAETERLLNEIEDNLRVLVPSVNTLDTEFGIEISLAMQPLRSENANLRRRLRILEQQVKHRDPCSEEDEPIRQHKRTSMILNQTLEKQLKEERSARDMLQQQLKTVSVDVNKLSREKNEMLQVLSLKDNSHIKSQQDWIEEAGRLRAELQSLEHERETFRRKASTATHEKEILTITLKEREKEVERLQELVSTFRSSMRKLVDDLSRPGPDYGNVGIVDHLNRTLQLESSPKKVWQPIDMTPTRDSDAGVGHFTHYHQPSSGLTTAALESHNERQHRYTDTEENHVTEAKTRVTLPETLSVGGQTHAQIHRSPETDYGLNMTETEYLGSPEIKGRRTDRNVAVSGLTSRESTGFIDLGASTVKGILGPFADRMRNLSPEKLPHELRSLSETDDISSADEDVTLTEHETRMRPENLTTNSSNTEQSRFSVTEYFEKYPQSKTEKYPQSQTDKSTNKENRPVLEPQTHSYQHDKPFDPEGDEKPERGTSGNSTRTPLVENNSMPKAYHHEEERTKVITPQRQLYQGTELDTTLSTIRETDDVISVISPAVTSSVSVTSIDDVEFREGFANLDANIARLQASLKQVIHQ